MWKQSRVGGLHRILDVAQLEAAGRDKPIEQGTMKLQVAREVVSHLSFGIYKNFARAVRELISNAYDAGATEVRIGLFLKPKNPKVVVRDNGLGMNVREMENRLFRIGNITPMDDTVDPLTKRKRIGQFGVGFLSTFPYCDLLTVVSKKSGEDKIVQVQLPTVDFFSGDTFNVTDYKVPYKVYASDLPKDKGETIVTLEQIKPHIVADLSHKREGRSASIDRFEGFEKFRWSICQFVPIQFPSTRKELNDFFTYEGRNPLRVWLDREELFRNVPKDAEILKTGEQTFGNVRTKYVLMSPMRPVTPEEARGLQVRVRDVGIGLPTDFDVVKLKGKVLGKLNHVCGEIHVVSGLVPIMIDRDSLSYTATVAEMQSFFRDELTRTNGTLERWARGDKLVYSYVENRSDSPEVVRHLRRSHIVRYPRERVRVDSLDEAPSTEDVAHVLEDRGFKVTIEKGQPSDSSIIEVGPDKETLTIWEGRGRPEKVTALGRSFQVDVEAWQPSESIESACRIEERKVIFNTAHPVFHLRTLDAKTARLLILGLRIVLERNPQRKEVFERLYSLLTEIL